MLATHARSLSRFDLIGGDITPATPNLVIYEVASAHGIPLLLEEATYQNKTLHQRLTRIKIKAVQEPFSQDDWRYIARYVNPDVKKWPHNKLRQAFDYLWHFKITNYNLDHLNRSFIAGGQTPEQPFTLNACLLYAFCHRYHLMTWPEMTLEQLSFAVRSLLTNPLDLLDVFRKDLMKIPTKDIINVYLSFYQSHKIEPTPIAEHQVNYNDLITTLQTITDFASLQKSYQPCNEIQAITLAAFHHHLDISSSQFPIAEYISLCHHPYLPRDPIFSKYYHNNRNLYSLDHHFNPLFGPEFYTKDCLLLLLSCYGHDGKDEVGRSLVYETPKNLHARLVEIYLYDNFYHGLRPKIKNSKSPFNLDDLCELSSNRLLCYGNPEDGFTFMTYEEMADFFRVNRSFIHPLDKKKQLNQGEIRRLRFLASLTYEEEKEEEQEERKRLLRMIAYAEAWMNTSEGILASFLDAYEETSPEIQEKIKVSLQHLFLLAMFMRGYELGDSFPIEDAPYKPLGEVGIRVCQGLLNWKKSLADLSSSWQDTINRLPLVKYQDGFVISNDDQVGYTLGDKIALVEVGDKSSNVVGTCIRTSSGWLAVSAYRYMTILGMKAPFNVTKLVYVT